MIKESHGIKLPLQLIHNSWYTVINFCGIVKYKKPWILEHKMETS